MANQLTALDLDALELSARDCSCGMCRTTAALIWRLREAEYDRDQLERVLLGLSRAEDLDSVHVAALAAVEEVRITETASADKAGRNQ